MADTILSVSRKNHTRELATGYQSLLESNFLVDCTISAEGQILKAHRLVLSACSPYFHMLFREEAGKHPFVILLDASFETLKAMIDFVYRGETQISERNLKAFLALGQSLQIKGLKVFSKNNKHKKFPCSATENDFQGPSEDIQNTCEVQCVHNSLTENPENFSQHHPHSSIDVEHSVSSVPSHGFSAPFSEEQSPKELPRPLECDEVPVNSEITMKSEPVCEEFSETRNEIVGNINSNEPMSGTFTSEIDGETSVFADQHLNRFPNCNDSSHGNLVSSVMRSSQQQIMKLSGTESVRDVTRENEPLLPVILVPKTEHLEDIGREEPMDDNSVPENDMYEIVEDTEPANLHHYSRSGDMPPENDRTSQQQSAKRLWSRGSRDVNPFLAQTRLQLHEHSQEPVLRTLDTTSSRLASIFFSDNRVHITKLASCCEICGATFKWPSQLIIHKRTHTGERPYSCKQCGKAFRLKQTLETHMRIHTGERPYCCDVCGKAFNDRSTFARHKRIHSGAATKQNK